jgi:hypothetical protein
MRFYLTFILVILLMSGCTRSSSLASRPYAAPVGGLVAGDRLGQSFAAQSDALADAQRREASEASAGYN